MAWSVFGQTSNITLKGSRNGATTQREDIFVRCAVAPLREKYPPINVTSIPKHVKVRIVTPESSLEKTHLCYLRFLLFKNNVKTTRTSTFRALQSAIRIPQSAFTLLFIIYFSLFIAASTAHCGIEWKRAETTLEIQQGQDPVEVLFPFTITGDNPISITSVKTTGPRVSVDTAIVGEHKPGAEGILKARYVPGAADSGNRVEKITVSTTDPGVPQNELRLRVRTTLVYNIEPRNALWHIGADPVAKDVYFTDITGKGIKPVALSTTSPRFTATLIPPEGKSFRYIIRIKPESTKEAGIAHVVLDVDMGDGTIKKRGIAAVIRDPNNPKAKLPRFDKQNNKNNTNNKRNKSNTTIPRPPPGSEPHPEQSDKPDTLNYNQQ